MARSPTHNPIAALTLGVLALSVSACSSGGDPAAATDIVQGDDPPGAARPLSIGGRAASEGENTFDIAINCAAALDLTAERLAQMTSNPQSDEIALLNRAESHFESRAAEAAAEDPEVIASPEAAIARRRIEKVDETAEQAQLAIACLRQFGTDVG